MIGELTIESLPKEISKTIDEIFEKTRQLEASVASLHPEKIFESFIKTDEFRRKLYEIDVLSQDLMDAYRLYAVHAAQAMTPDAADAPSEVDNDVDS